MFTNSFALKNEIIITNDGSHSIFNPIINESYHSKNGAIIEAMHIFIQNGFLSLKKKNINILEIGFGSGLNTLLTYLQAEDKLITTNYHTIERYPLKNQILKQLNYAKLIGIDKKKFLAIHKCNWQKENKISDYFKLTKNHIAIEKYNTNIKFDIIYFDAFSPEKQPELWTKKIFQKMYYFLKNNGTLITYCAKGVVKRTMKEVGFQINVLKGPPGKREITQGKK